MPTPITESLTSTFIKTGNKFRPSGSPKHIYVYVEDEIDSVFWHSFLDKHETDGYLFIISPIKTSSGIKCGKDSIFKYKPISSLGSQMWACIDADYDLIIPNYHQYTYELLRCKYVITTYVHSIESFKCHYSNLSLYISKATLSPIIPSIGENLLAFSDIIARFFLINITSIILKDGFYDFTAFYSDVNKISNHIDNINKMKQEAEKHIIPLIEYEEAKKQKISCIEAYLSNASIDSKSYYLFIRGHNLKKIVEKLLHKTCAPLYSKKIAEIKSIKKKEEFNNQYNKYKNETKTYNKSLKCRIEELIDDCTTYNNCEMYNKVESKIVIALDNK